jgi:hypothetical protein
MEDISPADNEASTNSNPEVTFEELAAQVMAIRGMAIRQVIFGLLWWLASAIAMFFALESTGSAIYYYGGALGSLFHWYRAIKLFNVTRSVGATKFMPIEKMILGVTVAIVAGTSFLIVPEYFHVTSPQTGTCYSIDSSTKKGVPVACWGSNADVKTIAMANSLEECPPEAVGYFDPSPGDARYVCLIKN